jgi:hypothetical protein
MDMFTLPSLNASMRSYSAARRCRLDSQLHRGRSPMVRHPCSSLASALLCSLRAHATRLLPHTVRSPVAARARRMLATPCHEENSAMQASVTARPKKARTKAANEPQRAPCKIHDARGSSKKLRQPRI